MTPRNWRNRLGSMQIGPVSELDEAGPKRLRQLRCSFVACGSFGIPGVPNRFVTNRRMVYD
jgi:hypothetical protein